MAPSHHPRRQKKEVLSFFLVLKAPTGASRARSFPPRPPFFSKTPSPKKHTFFHCVHFLCTLSPKSLKVSLFYPSLSAKAHYCIVRFFVGFLGGYGFWACYSVACCVMFLCALLCTLLAECTQKGKSGKNKTDRTKKQKQKKGKIVWPGYFREKICG